MDSGSQGGYTADQQGTQTRGPDEYSITPVTIRQVLIAEREKQPNEEKLRVDGRITGTITLVAAVRNISSQGSNLTVHIEDGTGAIDIRKWKDPSESSDEMENKDDMIPNVKVGDYVRAAVNPKLNGGALSLTVLSIHPVKDFNQVLYHQLDALASHLYTKRGPPPERPGASTGGRAQDDMLFVAGENPTNDVQAKIMRALENNPDGLHIDAITSMLRLDRSQVQTEIQNLSDVGKIYDAEDNTWVAIQS
uniref:ARAD1D40040p n=1 Tax=Blastobotrys adeninivorans TaxID=409370 RepID=A0A060TCN6_BLAAD